jgi:hypothetical protein
MSLNEFLLGALLYLAAAVVSTPMLQKLTLESVRQFAMRAAQSDRSPAAMHHAHSAISPVMSL